MDRVLVRSFRASDLAERAIKDLVRSRLDTGREVVFQPLGGRFLEAREDARRFEATWSRDVEKAFGIARGLDRDRDRPSALDPEAERLRQEWARASTRLFVAYTERLHGKATHKELAGALANARTARAAWSHAAGPLVDLRDIEHRQVFDVVRLRIEGGARYLRGPLEAHRRTVLGTAASRAADLPDESDRRLAVIAWPAGPDLQAAVYFNQRSRPQRPPSSIDAVSREIPAVGSVSRCRSAS